MKDCVAPERVLANEWRTDKMCPVPAENDTIRIGESAISYDTKYPVQLAYGTKNDVIFTSDGAIEIYEVALWLKNTR